MNKPELLVNAGNIAEIKAYLAAGASAITIGDEQFGLRMPGAFRLAEMKEAVELVHQQDAKLYVAINAMIHNEKLPFLDQYLRELVKLGVDAIEFADPAVLMTARSAAPGLPLQWNPEIISTSSTTINYWAKKGVTRAILAKELNMDEILEIKEGVEIEVGVQVHGISCIFHSKRTLVGSYYEHMGKERNPQEMDKTRGLYLKEEKREEESYPVYEDAFGTHIMSSEDICILEHLDELLDAGIDSLRIEPLMKPMDYNETVISAYRRAIDLYMEDKEDYEDRLFDLLDEIEQKQDQKRPLTTGFYFKEQVY
jgi:U32 family peptidase